MESEQIGEMTSYKQPTQKNFHCLASYPSIHMYSTHIRVQHLVLFALWIAVDVFFKKKKSIMTNA